VSETKLGEICSIILEEADFLIDDKVTKHFDDKIFFKFKKERERD